MVFSGTAGLKLGPNRWAKSTKRSSRPDRESRSPETCAVITGMLKGHLLVNMDLFELKACRDAYKVRAAADSNERTVHFSPRFYQMQHHRHLYVEGGNICRK